MKILFCITSMSSGGAERVMSVLVNHLSPSVDKVSLIYFSGKEPHYLINSKVHLISRPINYNSLPFIGPLFSLIKIYKNIFEELKQDQYDLVVSFLPYINLASILAANRCSLPVIVSERSNPVLSTNTPHLNFLRRLIYSRANVCVLQTSGVKKAFDYLKIDLPEVEVIPNPIDDSFFQSVPISQKENVILSVGRLSEEKGHLELVEAIELINESFDFRTNNWKVLIVGDGVLRKKINDSINEKGLNGIIELVGRKKNVKEYYQRSRIFVLSSKTEGFPNALLEAMANSCACISFDCDFGPKEIINHNEEGLLVQLGNLEELSRSILKVLTNHKLEEKLQMNARHKSQSYRQEVVVNKWMELFHKTIEKAAL